jgi:hypothetical protein
LDGVRAQIEHLPHMPPKWLAQQMGISKEQYHKKIIEALQNHCAHITVT